MKDLLFVEFNEKYPDCVTTDLHAMMLGVKSASTIPMRAVYTKLGTGNFPKTYSYAENPLPEGTAIPVLWKHAAIQVFLAPDVVTPAQFRKFQLQCAYNMLHRMPSFAGPEIQKILRAASDYLENDLLNAYEGCRESIRQRIADRERKNAKMLSRLVSELDFSKELRIAIAQAAIGCDALRAAEALFLGKDRHTPVDIARKVIATSVLLVELEGKPYKELEGHFRDIFEAGWEAAVSEQFEDLLEFGNPFEN